MNQLGKMEKMRGGLEKLPVEQRAAMLPLWAECQIQLSDYLKNLEEKLDTVLLEVQSMKFDLDCTKNERDDAYARLEG